MRLVLNTRTWSLFWIAILLIWIALAPTPSMDLEHLLEFPRDAFGRDLFSALGEAMRRSLIFAGITTGIATGVGILAGAFVGMMEGRPRFLAERILDFFLAFPSILLALGVQAIIGTGWSALTVSVSVGLFPIVVRFVSARAKEVALADYVAAAHALGGSPASVFWRHYRPPLLDHLRLKFPSLFAQALLLEATLSFLHLGVQPGVLSWGSLLTQAKDYLIEAPHIAWITGIPLVLTLLSLQSLTDRSSRH